MQLVVFALLGCCVIANSASLSDTLAISKSNEESLSSVDEGSAAIEELTPEDVKREKRSGLGGSGGFFAGIGSAILGKVAQASSGISSGSSDGSRGSSHQYESVEYGPPVHGYDEQNFDIWSFKKAILNTLFQALKAIGGGVIALKGKLIKGGGVVISAKGNIISAKGEAISTLGRQIAASAVLAPPKSAHSYLYEAPVHVPSGHDSYAGPPPSSYNPHGGYAAVPSVDSYGHSGYAAPSDDADHPGLLIVKPLKPETSQYGSYQNSNSGSSSQHPAIALLSQSFGGGQKSSGLENLLSKFAGASKSNTPLQSSGKGNTPSSPEVSFDVAHTVEHVEHKEHDEHQPAEVYGPPGYDKAGSGQDHQETHVLHTGDNSNGEVHHHGGGLDSSVVSHAPEGNLQQNDQLINTDQYHNQNFGFGNGGQLSHGSFDSLANGPVLFSMPVETSLLQSYNQPAYYSGNNQLQDLNLAHNTYNSVLRRNSRSKTSPISLRILPAVGYTLKNSRVYRI